MERFIDRASHTDTLASLEASSAWGGFPSPGTTSSAPRRSHDGAPGPAHGAEIEPQPVIVADDRRMAVRALRLWERLKQGRELPWIADFDAVGHPDFSANAMLIVLPNPGLHGEGSGCLRPAIAHLGERLRSESGIWQIPRYLDDLPPLTISACVRDGFNEAMSQGLPQQFSGEYIDLRSQTVLYRGTFLPFAASAERAALGKADCIYAVVNWRYALDAAASAALSEEVRAALDGLGAAALSPPEQGG